MDKVYSHLKGKMRRILRHTSIRVCMISRLCFFICQNLAKSFARCDIMHTGWQHLCLFIFSFLSYAFYTVTFVILIKLVLRNDTFISFLIAVLYQKTSRVMTSNFNVLFRTYHAPITDSIACWMREKYKVIIYNLIDSMTTRHSLYT